MFNQRPPIPLISSRETTVHSPQSRLQVNHDLLLVTQIVYSFLHNIYTMLSLMSVHPLLPLKTCLNTGKFIFNQQGSEEFRPRILYIYFFRDCPPDIQYCDLTKLWYWYESSPLITPPQIKRVPRRTYQHQTLTKNLNFSLRLSTITGDGIKKSF